VRRAKDCPDWCGTLAIRNRIEMPKPAPDATSWFTGHGRYWCRSACRRARKPLYRHASTKTIDQLIAASSLGSPEAMAVRNMPRNTPPDVADRLIRADEPSFYRARLGRRRTKETK